MSIEKAPQQAPVRSARPDEVVGAIARLEGLIAVGKPPYIGFTADTMCLVEYLDALEAQPPAHSPVNTALPAGSLVDFLQPMETFNELDETGVKRLVTENHVHEGCAMVLVGTNGKPIGWIDTHVAVSGRVYRHHIINPPAALTQPVTRPSASAGVEWLPIDRAKKEAGEEILGVRLDTDGTMIKEPFISFWSPSLNKFYCDPTHYIELPLSVAALTQPVTGPSAECQCGACKYKRTGQINPDNEDGFNVWHSPAGPVFPPCPLASAPSGGAEEAARLREWVANELRWCEPQGKASKSAVYILKKMQRDFPALSANGEGRNG